MASRVLATVAMPVWNGARLLERALRGVAAQSLPLGLRRVRGSPSTGPRCIALVVSGLTAGGTERVVSVLTRAWAERGDEVHVLTLNGVDGGFYPIDARVRLHPVRLPLGGAGLTRTLVRATHAANRVSEALVALRPDVLVGFGAKESVVAALAAAGNGVRVVAVERTNAGRERRMLGPSWHRLLRLAQLASDRVIVQTQASYAKHSRLLQRRAQVVANPVPAAPVRASPGSPGTGGRYRVVTLGRLHPVKGHDLLVRAWARCAQPDWDLVIYGEGGERERLTALARSLGVAVELPGVTSEHWARLAEAHVFVLPSRHEGFPNALCEAMAAGLPVIASDCPNGPAEIVTHGIDGLLVPSEDPAAMATALAALMRDPVRRERLGAAARGVATRFSIEAAVRAWDRALAP